MEKQTADQAYLEEYIAIKLFKDNDRYKDDVYVAINGKNCVIKRGEWVKIKRKFALVLDQSEIQDTKAAQLMQAEQNRFEEVVKDKSHDQLSEEEKRIKQEIEQKVSTLTAQRNARLTEIGTENSTVRQLTDLALLEAGLLTGEKLSQFIQRSMSMLK